MTDHDKELFSLLELKDAFKAKWEYDPFDNYAWREEMAFGYLRKYYSTIKKIKGRYGHDGICSELNLTNIENKSTKLKKRKRTNDYNINSSRFQFDVSKKLDKLLKSDAFIFALFDSDRSGYPIHLLFVHEKQNVEQIKEMVVNKKKNFESLDESKKGHEHIDLIYDDIQHLGDKFGDYMPTNNIMEFMK